MKIFTLISIALISSFSYAVDKNALLKEHEIVVDGVSFESVTNAKKAIRDGSSVYFGPGVFSEGLHIKHNNVKLIGQQGTHFKNIAIEQKATFVISGSNVLIENIECSGVSVSAGNGACIRHQGKDLTVSGVHFHHSQQGILTSKNSGFLKVRFSLFEHLGNNGQAHGIYANGDALYIEYSKIINSIDQGHEVKSRAAETAIRYSTIGSITTKDSRAIDIPNGGALTVQNSVLLNGPATVNRQLIGYGLEGLARNREHAIAIKDNIIMLERNASNEFLAFHKQIDSTLFTIEGNVFIGDNVLDQAKYEIRNHWLKNRKEGHLAADSVPQIDLIHFLRGL